ncbi:uncharacterized protein NECHADRAFT_41312 [Fusarium vanettenii 77-13-4]|uniref:Nephrocystin 3-like N-terminal domain-containing protein n=1 Tax=Fusarium vanettenii (strain ATCC MYA-4622 / CBS 123669 / FGSC 9596 / NRRL 45880 / 77-13-4) TaxID=660122 RepID=C7YSY4_FUSV7|nr:uncharacterized protein NECHADRAFT_41312 [Fusarium vanettenii 77-13-4]EEU45316.1 hypothetical protein NECHADRAFT_41312 [Fusarium vanettenii 77-13-4]
MDIQLLQHLYGTDLSAVKECIEGAAGSLPREVYAWIIEDANFQRFLHSSQPQLLWINGDTGHCQTVLLCGIIDELCGISDTVVSYSLYQGTSSYLDTAAAVVGELIRHLVEQRPNLLGYVREKYDLSGKALSDDLASWQGLGEVLQAILGHPSMNDAVLIIDNVDERTAEVGELFQFITRSSSDFPSKWILSSRGGMSLRPRLDTRTQGSFAVIDLDLAKDQISQAVGAYARYRAECLAVLKNYEDSVRSDIYAYLVFNAGGDFLWVSTVCRELENHPPWDILKFLSSLPAGVLSLYDKLHLTTRRSRDGELCQEVLAIVATVYRPQTVAELKILVKPFEFFHKDEALRYFITSNCGSFLTIRGDTVDFIDRSARDYIRTKIPPADAALQHKHIFIRSLASLSGILHRDMYALGATGQPYSCIHRPTPDPLAPVRYATMYWIHHFAAHRRLVEGGGTSALADLISVLTFLRTFGLFWLESQMLIQGDIDISGMETFIEWTPLKNLRDLTQDLIRLATDFKPALQASPMQLYASALVFSENETPVRQHFKEQAPLWVTGQAISNSSSEIDLSRIQVLELTPNGSLLAMVSGDYIMIRNMSTLETTWMFRAEGVSCMSFSYHPWLACGTYQGSVRIWDVDKKKAYRRLPRIDEPGVAALAFSSDGCQLVLATLIDTIEVWDVLSRTLVRRFPSTRQLTSRSLRHRGATLFMTDRGPLSIDSRGLAQATEAELETDYHVGFEVSDGDDWITKDGYPVLWLPPLYRVSSSTVSGNVVVIGCQAGGVLRFQFA